MTDETKLLVMDCGLEDQEMLANLYDRPNTDFILKHNRRRESSQNRLSRNWLELAKEKDVVVREDEKRGFLASQFGCIAAAPIVASRTARKKSVWFLRSRRSSGRTISSCFCRK